MQDCYGKTPRQLEILMDWMIENLKIFSLEVIESCFSDWLKKSTKIPTPAEMFKLCEEKTDKLNKKDWTADYDFGTKFE